MDDQPRVFVVDTPAKLARVAGLIQKLPLEGRIWDIGIKPWTPRRSVDQNKRLWKLHQIAGREAGYAPAELHETMLGEFFGWMKVKTPWGEFTVPRERSHDKNKKVFREFSDFCEQKYIEHYGVFLGDQDG